ncbi:hypothetical protein MTO96_020362 [Rhipicephalus appendiculatus]
MQSAVRGSTRGGTVGRSMFRAVFDLGALLAVVLPDWNECDPQWLKRSDGGERQPLLPPATGCGIQTTSVAAKTVVPRLNPYWRPKARMFALVREGQMKRSRPRG